MFLFVYGGRGNFELLVKLSGIFKLDGYVGLYIISYKFEIFIYILLFFLGLLEFSKG